MVQQKVQLKRSWCGKLVHSWCRLFAVDADQLRGLLDLIERVADRIYWVLIYANVVLTLILVVLILR